MNIKRKVLEYITDHHDRWNQTLSLEEVRQAHSSFCEDVDAHLVQLEREGLVTVDHELRNVSLSEVFRDASRVQVLGAPRASTAIKVGGHAPANSVVFDLKAIGVPAEQDMHGFLVPDDSMTGAGFEPGDFVIFKRGGFAQGEIVAVTIDGQRTLRRYVVLSGIPHLLADNCVRPDLKSALDTPIHGVFWGFLRVEPEKDGLLVKPCHRISYSSPEGHRSDRVPRTKAAMPMPLCRKQKKRATVPHRRSKPEQKETSKKMVPEKPEKNQVTCNWPSPPSGIELNDQKGQGYKIASAAMVDERPDQPYNHEHFQAIEEFVRNFEPERD